MRSSLTSIKIAYVIFLLFTLCLFCVSQYVLPFHETEFSEVSVSFFFSTSLDVHGVVVGSESKPCDLLFISQ